MPDLCWHGSFANPKGDGYVEHLGPDGLPEVGSKLQQGMALWRAVLSPPPRHPAACPVPRGACAPCV